MPSLVSPPNAAPRARQRDGCAHWLYPMLAYVFFPRRMSSISRDRRPDETAGRLLVVAFLVCVASIVEAQASPANAAGSAPGAIPELRLNLTPMQEPFSTWVRIAADGQARAVRYSPHRLVVVADTIGTIPQAETERLFEATRTRAFRAALAGHQAVGDGLSRGDQFALALVDGQASGTAIGFIDEAAPEIRHVVQEMLSVFANLDQNRRAQAYVRAEIIEPNRLEWLKARGKPRFLRFDEMSGPAQDAVSAALDSLGEFQPITQAQFDALAVTGSGAREIFLLRNAAGFQVQIFESE